jgi:Predicted helicases
MYAWFSRRTIPWRPFTTRGAILSSIIVFDEAHLIQDLYFYSQHLFTKFIEVLAIAGVPVVVSSATLPDEVVNNVKDSLGSEIEVIDASVYGKGKLSVIEFPQHNEVVQIKAAIDKLYEIVMGGVKESKDILIVVNSVKVAFEIYYNLKERIKNSGGEIIEVYDFDFLSKQIEKQDSRHRAFICLLHGRLSAGVRARREGLFEILRSKKNELKQKGIEKKWSIVVVATQVAEVGIDYSFDIVITEIAPLTAVIQRLMRAGREERQEAKAYVLPPITIEESERIPSYTIYGRELIDYSLTNCSRLVNGNLNDIAFL